MPTIKVEVFKRYQGEAWGNVYHIAASTVNSVLAGVQNFIDLERAIHLQVILIEYIRIADLDPATETFATFPVNQQGQVAFSEVPFPLWNCVRVDLTTAGLGRPGRKYYRGALAEDNYVAFGEVSGGTVTTVNAAWATFIGNWNEPAAPCQPDGDVIVGAMTQTRVAMRQLHRKRRSSGTPTP